MSRNETGNADGNKRAVRKNGKRPKGLNTAKKLEPQKPLSIDSYLQLPTKPA